MFEQLRLAIQRPND